MQLYNVNFGKFYEKVSVRTVFTGNPVRNSTRRNDGVQKKANF